MLCFKNEKVPIFRIKMLSALTFVVTCLALCGTAKSVKLNDRLLCEVCHAIGNYTDHTLLKVGVFVVFYLLWMI